MARLEQDMESMRAKQDKAAVFFEDKESEVRRTVDKIKDSVKKTEVCHLVRLSGRKSRSRGQGLSMCVVAGVFYGGKVLSPMVATRFVPASTDPVWNEALSLGVAVADLPQSARLCLPVWVLSKKKESHFWRLVSPDTGDAVDDDGPCGPIGCISVQLFDFRGELLSGAVNAKILPGDVADPIGTCTEPPQHASVGQLSIQSGSPSGAAAASNDRWRTRHAPASEEGQGAAPPATPPRPVPDILHTGARATAPPDAVVAGDGAHDDSTDRSAAAPHAAVPVPPSVQLEAPDSPSVAVSLSGALFVQHESVV